MDYDVALFKGDLAGIDEVYELMEERENQILEEVTEAHPRMKWWEQEDLAKELGEDDEIIQELKVHLEELEGIQEDMRMRWAEILEELKEERPGLEDREYKKQVEKISNGDYDYQELWKVYDSVLYVLDDIKERLEEECA